MLKGNSKKGCIKKQVIVSSLLASIILSGCGVANKHHVRKGNDPRYQDEDVAFRNTYYFRVFDHCKAKANGQGYEGVPEVDSLYRFRMTGKADTLWNEVRFESGTLKSWEIDPLGSAVVYDENLKRFRFQSKAETDLEVNQNAAWNDYQKLLKEYGRLKSLSSEDWLAQLESIGGAMSINLAKLTLESEQLLESNNGDMFTELEGKVNASEELLSTLNSKVHDKLLEATKGELERIEGIILEPTQNEITKTSDTWVKSGIEAGRKSQLLTPAADRFFGSFDTSSEISVMQLADTTIPPEWTGYFQGELDLTGSAASLASKIEALPLSNKSHQINGKKVTELVAASYITALTDFVAQDEFKTISAGQQKVLREKTRDALSGFEKIEIDFSTALADKLKGDSGVVSAIGQLSQLDQSQKDKANETLEDALTIPDGTVLSNDEKTALIRGASGWMVKVAEEARQSHIATTLNLQISGKFKRQELMDNSVLSNPGWPTFLEDNLRATLSTDEGTKDLDATKHDTFSTAYISGIESSKDKLDLFVSLNPELKEKLSDRLQSFTSVALRGDKDGVGNTKVTLSDDAKKQFKLAVSNIFAQSAAVPDFKRDESGSELDKAFAKVSPVYDEVQTRWLAEAKIRKHLTARFNQIIKDQLAEVQSSRVPPQALATLEAAITKKLETATGVKATSPFPSSSDNKYLKTLLNNKPDINCSGNLSQRKGFQILGPEGWRTFDPDERLIMAMHSSNKPLTSTLSQLSQRVLNAHKAEEESLIPLVEARLRASEAQRLLERDILGNGSTDDGVTRSKQVCDLLNQLNLALNEEPAELLAGSANDSELDCKEFDK